MRKMRISIKEQNEDKNTLVSNGGMVIAGDSACMGVDAVLLLSVHLAVNRAREADGINDVRNVIAVVDGKNEATNDEIRVIGTG